MKPLFGIVAGFVVSLGMFAGGLAFAAYMLAVEPVRAPDSRQNVAELWSQEPRPVDQEAQDFERVPATTAAPTAEPEGETLVAMADAQTMNDAGTEIIEDDENAGRTIDSTTTGSLQPVDDSEQPQETDRSEELSLAHRQWCAEHYRSYRPETDSYTAYSGGQRRCNSPYSEEIAVDRPASAMGDVRYAAGRPAGPAAPAVLSSAHVRDCMSRYRSYRPQDNTYQPYGGGPRQQCR
jgi:hypothetical protein